MEQQRNTLTRGVEIATNVALILLAVIASAALVKNYLLPRPATSAKDLQQATSNPPDSKLGLKPGPAQGTRVSVTGVDWSESDETVLLALSNQCHFCSESAPFYQRLVRELAQQKGVRVVAVFPQEASEGKKYLEKLGVPIEQVRQASLDSVGVRGTPTLMILNKEGVVEQSWVGRLSADKESEVLSRIKT